LDADVSWNIPDKTLTLTWQASVGNALLKTNIFAAEKIQGQGNLSNFTLMEQGVSGNSWSRIINERLKFFQVIAKVKVGLGTCKPECWQLGEIKIGWYDPCTEELLKEDNCAVREPKCCFTNTRSEGWYNAPCDQAKAPDDLIEYAECESDEYALACNQSSDIFIKFTQPLIHNEAQKGGGRSGDTPNTSINWFLFLPIEGIHSTKDFLLSDVPIDYIAKWNVMRQDQQGSARGWFNKGRGVYGIYEEDHRYETQSEQGNNYMTGAAITEFYYNQYQGGYISPGDSIAQGLPEYTITGNFPLTDNSPYFVAATMDFDDFTWVGELPEHVSYDLKHVPGTVSGNYLALPLDTRLAKAVDGAWDMENQNYINDGTMSVCAIIRGPGQGSPLNFDIAPGQVYEIQGLDRDIYWEQI
jgi:hypothetical protein